MTPPKKRRTSGVDSARTVARRVTAGNAAPRNKDADNKVIVAARAKAQSIQSSVEGWERNTDKIQARVDEVVNHLQKRSADIKTLEYWTRKIIRNWGGDTSKYPEFLKRVSK